MPSIRKRAMKFFDRLNLGALKGQCRKLVARAAFPSRSRRSISRPITIGNPTDIRKDPDPFSSMIALPANRDYIEREGIIALTPSCRSQDLRTRSTPEPRSASSRSASTQAERSRTYLAQAVTTSEEQTPAGLAGSDFLFRESALEVRLDMT